MSKPEGEGGVSMGPMVPVYSAPSIEAARRLVTVLDEHHIPSLIDLEVPGAAFVGADSTHDRAPRIVVPLAMFESARELLRHADAIASASASVSRDGEPPSHRRRSSGGPTDSSGPGQAHSHARAFRRPASLLPPEDGTNFPENNASDSNVGPGASPLSTRDVSSGPIFRRQAGSQAQGAGAGSSAVGWGEFAPDEPFGESFADEVPLRPRELPELTPFRVRLLLLLMLVSLVTSLQVMLEHFLGHGQVVADLAADARWTSEPWRFVTASFIHGGPAHLLSNALFGVLIGSVLFDTHLFGALLFVWLASSAAGLWFEVSFSGAGIVVLGASAGNYGLVGLWTKGQLERAQRTPFLRWERLRTIGVIALLAPGALTPVTESGTRVAVIAHVVGYGAGFLMGYVFHRRVEDEDLASVRKRSSYALVVAVAVLVLAVGAACYRMFGRG